MNMHDARLLVFSLWAAASIFGCMGTLGDGGVVEDDLTGGEVEPEDLDRSTMASYSLPIGAKVEVCNVNYGVNNRSGPSTSYPILRVVLGGTEATTLKRSGNWYKISVEGHIGWSYGRYLCHVAVDVGAASGNLRVCNVNYGVNNRSGPSTSYPILRVLTLDTVAKQLARSGSWYKLDASGAVGWSHENYLCPTSATPPPAPTPTPTPPCVNCGNSGATGLLSPPNFDLSNVVGGYYLLPYAQPSGLYTRKADACARGTQRLVDVLYTVAKRFQQKWPSLAPITFRDLNFKSSCSTLNHATHDDGTHADIKAGCGTNVSCSDPQPAIDLAKMLVDTGMVCGIIFNDKVVQSQINPYFASKHSYTPWHKTFMRSVSGHTSHFHIRVKKPNGSCN